MGLLGPLQVETGGQPALVRPPKQRALVGLLAVRAGAPVSFDELIDFLWGEDPPRSARKAVQTYVADIRRLLPVGTIMTTANGYALKVDEVDSVCFERLAGEGRALVARSELCGAKEAYAVGLGLWRGPALVDLGDSPAARSEAVRLEELRCAVEEDLAEVRLGLGEHEKLIDVLEAAVAAAPLRERRWGQLMLALHRSGRQAEALRAFQRVRHHLDEELGLDPGPELVGLERAIAARDPALQWRPLNPVPSNSGPAPTPRAGNGHRRLASAANRFVGRRVDCDEVIALLSRGRLVTVVGSGGCGKTRMAVEVANRVVDDFVDGVALARLADVGPDGVAAAIAAAIGIEEEPGQPLAATLAAAMVERQLLLVLDNCEHVIESAARLAEDLVVACPGLAVLATSREPLRCPSESRWRLAPLTPAAAAELFVDRAAAVTTRTDPDAAERAAIMRICERLDGIPLAVEIAAARLEAFSPTELLEALDHRFDVLVAGARTAEERHRTLRGAIDWSYQLLGEPERRQLRRLSVLVGGGAHTEVVAISGADVSSLIEKSLVVRTGGAGPSRLLLHETIRHYSGDRLAEAGEVAEARSAHADVYLSLADSVAPKVRGPGQDGAMNRLEPERSNIGAALEWVLAEQNWRVAGRYVRALWWYWFRSNQSAAVVSLLRPALVANCWADDPFVPAAAGYLAWVIDDFALAAACAAQALSTPDAPVGARALAAGVLARVHGDRGDFGSASRAARQSEQLYQLEGDPWTLAWVRRCRASAALYGGEIDEARTFTADALGWFEQVGDDWAVAGCLDLLAGIAVRSGDARMAHDLAERSVDAHRRHHDGPGTRLALLHQAEAARHAGDRATARRAGHESLELSQRYGYRVGALHAHLFLAQLAADEDRTAVVADHTNRASLLARQLDDPAAQSAASALAAQSGALGDTGSEQLGAADLVQDQVPVGKRLGDLELHVDLGG